jgi:predicted CopG family antitoxin
MSKTITIADDVYELLLSLKQGSGDSFCNVLRRHVHAPVESAGALLDAYETEPAHKVDFAALDRLQRQRGRRQ